MHQASASTITVAETNDVSAPVVTATTCAGIASVGSSLTQGTWSSSAMGSLAGTIAFVALGGGTCSVTIADGNGQSQAIAITALASGAMMEFTSSTLTSPSSHYGVALGSDGNLWVTENGHLAKITPTGALTEFDLSSSLGTLIGITGGPNGNLWITYATSFTGTTSGIAKVSTSGSILNTYAYTTFPGSLAPDGPIVAAADGNIWFTAVPNTNENFNTAGKLMKISTSGSSSSVCSGTTNPVSLVASADGSTLYALETLNSTAGFWVLTATTSGTCNESEITALSQNTLGTSGNFNYEGLFVAPYTYSANYGSMTLTTDGSVWGIIGAADGTESNTPTNAPLAYRLSPSTWFSANGTIEAIAGGPDGNLWLALSNGVGTIERTSTSFLNVSTYTQTSAGAQLSGTPVALLQGPSGNMWFVESNGHYGYISP